MTAMPIVAMAEELNRVAASFRPSLKHVARCFHLFTHKPGCALPSFTPESPGR